MKKILTLLSLLFIANAAFAQPANDDCAGILHLGTAPICNTTVYDNLNATTSMIGNDNLPVSPSCLGLGQPLNDVWFQFTAADTILDYRFTVTGTGSPMMLNPLVILYRGDCLFDGLAEAGCALADVGTGEVILDVVGLTPGLEYFLRITDYGGATTEGNFTLCVDEIPPATDITQGSSNLASGILYDSGGKDGNYQADENFTFKICPTDGPACLTFTLDWFNLENGELTGLGEILSFYDGDDPLNDPLLAEISGAFEPFQDPYVTGGGGVCFKVMATSGCMTIVFSSDNGVQFEGFAGHWESSGTPCEPVDIVEIDDDIPNSTIENFVAAAATQVTITNIQCAQGGYGTFLAGDNSELGLKKGLILTSGLATNAIGPNISGGISDALLGDGDADLDYLSLISGNGSLSNDACVIELDVFVATPELTFEYIFGSDEYTFWVNSTFNDIFAFLVSGPGIVGDPNIGNQKNLAVLPFTTTPVQINSVNNIDNWQFYRNNENGTSVEYDGLTSDSLGIKKSLTARQKVTPCQTYHLKLAIADRGDFSLDSGVFIADIKGGAPELSVAFASGVDYLIEPCTGAFDQLLITLDEAPDTATTYGVVVTGTATTGVDYTLPIPSFITFQPGQLQLAFPLIPIMDGLVEGTETIIITLTKDYGCGLVNLEEIIIDIQDQLVVTVTAGDTALVCAGGTLQLQADGAASYFWSPPGAVSNPNIGNPTITPANDIWLKVTGAVGPCVDYDSVFVKIIGPTIDLIALSPTDICQGTSVVLQVTDNVNHAGLEWSPKAGLSDLGPNPTATPTESVTYTATIEIAGCKVSDEVSFKVDTLFWPKLTTLDTTICQNYSIDLGQDIDPSTTIYQWTPSTGLSATNVSGPIASPLVTTTYQLIATSSNQFCADTATVKVFVIPADVAINGDPYREICLGDSLQIFANVSGGGSLVWTSSAGPLTNPTANPIWASPDESALYTAAFTINTCTVFDSIYIRVDSMPDQTIMVMASPVKDVYCPGELIKLVSPTYEPANFPDLNILWVPMDGSVLTPDTFWNLIFNTTDTITFKRILSNRACRDTSEVTINVFEPIQITATVSDNYTCPGDLIQLNSTGQGQFGVEWEGAAVSNVNSPNPTANPTTTTTYTVKLVDVPCPASASVQVDVAPTPQILTAPLIQVCTGEPAFLQPNFDPNVSFVWTGPGGFASSSSNPAVIPAVAGTYFVTATGINSCTNTGQTTVEIPVATVNAGPDIQLCPTKFPISVEAIVSGAPGGNFQWSNGLSSSKIDVQLPGSPQKLSVIYEYGPNCEAYDTINVAAFAGINLDIVTITPDPNPDYCEGQLVTFKAQVASSQTYTIEWVLNGKVAEGGKGDSLRINLEPVNPNAWSVVATTTDGCTAANGGVVGTKPCREEPNAFTPNGDGTNDYFEIFYEKSAVTIEDLKIYARWGELMYDNDNIQQRWDGTINGKPAPMDTYIYRVTYRLSDGTLIPKSGDITLIR